MTGGVKVNVSIDNPKMTKKAIVSMLAAKEGLDKATLRLSEQLGRSRDDRRGGDEVFHGEHPGRSKESTIRFPDIIIVKDMDDVCSHLACIGAS